ncbi:MAG TPA: transglycosylase family protein, partial [Vicinamibacterales bacterium]|nr:transglycosylase family protein [Vicinamibacterales bacterium]
GLHNGGAMSVSIDDDYRRGRALEVMALRRRQLEYESMVCRATTTARPLFSHPRVAAASSRAPAARIESDPFRALASSTPYRVTVLGDSVILGARHFIERRIASARTDAAVGRQAADMVTRIEELRAAGLLAPKVVLHVGTNGVVTNGQLRAMLELLSDRERVVLVKTVAPRRWVDDNNAAIDNAAADYPNAVVAEWDAVAADHPEYFVSDQVHLSAAGLRAFVDEIIRVGAFSAEDFSARAPAVKTTPWTPAAGAPPVVKLARPRALDSFWDAMARCETGSNWKDPGRFAGGLGIYIGTWQMFGGHEFAAHPTEATREQQIEVANRVSTQGWQKSPADFVEPVGFSGWGCLKVVGQPVLVEHEPASVAAQAFDWGHSGPVVRDLQRLLGVTPDGVYGTGTWTAHLQYLKNNGLAINLAPK